MKRKILLLFITFIPFWLNAQFLQPNAIAPGYAHGTTPNYSIQAAFGQLFNNNYTTDSLKITEGFLQSGINVWVGDSLNYFKIGEIPDFNVWQNILTEFYVTADTLGDNPVFSIEYDTLLFTGLITMDSIKGKFKFMPSANDFISFTITFKATKDTLFVTQEVPFTINAQLPPEGVAFGLEPTHPLPLGDDNQYIIKTVLDTTTANFNYTDGTGLKLVTIAGKEIVIEDGHPNNIYVYNNQKTTRKLTIFAERVVVKSQFYLPQTDVEIHCKELLFIDPPGKSGEAFICTTPVTNPAPSGNANGVAGLKAGSITLHIKDFSAPNAYRFFLDGGQGQTGNSSSSSNNSGNGGNGGDFKSTINLFQFVSVNPGPAGAITNSSTPGVPGLQGTKTMLDYKMSWLRPLAMKTILLHAKDAYLYNYLDYTRSVCEEYFAYVDYYQTLTTEWDALPTKIQGDLVQQQQEFQTIAQQIGSNKDFFGNPAGWVPMVSFEVTKAMFDQEIDRAMRVMYLSYWIKNTNQTMTQKRAAMQTALDETKGLLEENLTAYDEVIAILPTLESRSQEISAEVDTTLAQISRMENEMMERAEAIVEYNHRPKKRAWWQKACDIAGKVMQVIPLYQPALGAIGSGLQTVANMDFSDPLGSAQQLIGVGTALYNTNWSASYSNLTQGLSNLDPSQIGGIGDISGYVKDLQQYRRPVSDILGIINEKAQETKLPAEEIQTELSKLMAENSDFKEIGIRIDSLKKVQGEFYTDFMNAMQKSARLIDEIQEGALSVDALDVSLVELGDRMIYARSMDYLNGMEQRARNRLIKYHYYMAKAFEYRLVQAYPGELDLLDIYDQFQTFATANANHLLTPDQFDALKAIYEEQLSTITEIIYEQFINNPPVSQSVTEYVFWPQEIAKLNSLNSGESVFINLFESSKGIFTLGEEDIRINNITFNIQYHTEGGTPGPSGNFELYLYHSGESRIHKDGEIYVFRHYNDKTTNPLKWGKKMFASGNTQSINPSYASQSLLLSLISSHNPTPNQIMLFSRPSAWADIELRKLVNTTTNTKFVIDNLTLFIDYDFNQNLSKSVVEIRVGEIGLSKNRSNDETANQVMSLVDISKKDLGDRTDGRGFILRSYQKNNTQTVNLTAEQEFGSYQFDSWSVYGKEGMDVAPDVYRSSQISLNLGQSRRAFLNYIYVEPVMEVVQDTLFAAGEGEEKTFTILNKGNGVLKWDVYSDDSWITFPNGNHGEGDTLAGFEVLANPAPEPRIAYVVVAAPDSPVYLDTVWVVQEGFGDNIAIQLEQGWSGLSSYIQPSDPDIGRVFEDISDDIAIVQNMNGVYWPGQNVNTLVNWNMASGYAIKTNNSTSLSINGNRNYGKTINLTSGWSMIPVLSSCEVPVYEIFGTVAWNLKIAKEVAGTKIFWPQYGINTIGSLQPGNAYYVFLQNNGFITFTDCEVLKSEVISKSSKPETIEPWGAVTTSNLTHLIAIPQDLISNSELKQGDIAGVFSSNGTFSGYTEIQSGLNNYITVFGGDPTDPKQIGIKHGDLLTLKVYRPETDKTYLAEVEYLESLPQQGLFVTNGISGLKSINLIEDNKQGVRVYPNPASGNIYIDCGSISGLTMKVYDMYGKLIINKTLSTGTFTLQTENTLQPGVYNFEFSNENLKVTKRIVVK